MRPIEDRSYRTREFAELAGVTVRALHHYDRLGLLKAKRTRAAYRAYAARDLERLEQIIARTTGSPAAPRDVIEGSRVLDSDPPPRLF